MNEYLPLIDKAKIVTGVAPVALTADGDFVSLKNHARLTIIISIDNGSTVTGTAVTVDQAQDVSATGVKELAFTKMWAITDVAASATLTETAVPSNTFTTSTTNAKNLLYVIEIDAADLDTDNNFDCVRVGCASAANSVGCVLYILHGERYAPSIAKTAITD